MPAARYEGLPAPRGGPASCERATLERTPPPTRSRWPNRRWSRSPPSTPNRSSCCSGSTARAISHRLLDWARDARIGFSVGYDLTETIRVAILKIPDEGWVTGIDQDGGNRPNGHVTEITDLLDLTGWPAGSRVLVRRERADPGAQLTFTDIDGHRFQAILTDQASPDIAQVERDHRARVEDHIRNDKDTGMRNMPFRDFEHNRVSLQVVRLAHDLIVWTQRLLLTGQLARCEPKRLRYRLLHVAARLAFHARTATLHLQASWPWASELAAAFAKLKALPAPT